MPRYATDQDFTHERARETYQSGTLSTGLPWRSSLTLRRHRDGTVVLPGVATTLRPFTLRGESGYVVRYHETDVVMLYSNGDVVLDDGGWTTRFTAQRMSTYTPAWVHVRAVGVLSGDDPHIDVIVPGQQPDRLLRSTRYVAPDLSPMVPVTEVEPDHSEAIVCGTCRRAWVEDVTPAGRCPWEHLHMGGAR